MTINSISNARDASLAEVRKSIEEDIIFGRFAPGARLIEDVLMERYDTTRHVVRQALVQLEQAGIIRREKNIGATVRSYTPDEVRDIYEVREMLTRQAVLKIALPASPEIIRQLSEIQKQYIDCISANNLRGIHETNDAFHITMFSACSNPYLVSSLQHYMGLTLPMRAKNLADRSGLEVSACQHDTMIKLLQGSDSWALAQLCVDHMQPSKVDYLKRIAEHQEPSQFRRARSS